MAPADDKLARQLAPLLLEGQSPEAVEQGNMVRPGFGLEDALLSQQKSAMEPTLAPGEWEGMSRQQAQVRTLGQLGNIALSGPGIGETMPQALRPNLPPQVTGRLPRARLRGQPTGVEQAPTFYSQARTVLEDPRVQETQTGEQWQRFLADPKRGVKAEEMKYTGLADMLMSKFGQRVGKAEIAKHLDENEIEVKEVTKSGQRGNSDATKFSQYTLPGAENYREVLLTLPAKERSINVG